MTTSPTPLWADLTATHQILMPQPPEAGLEPSPPHSVCDCLFSDMGQGKDIASAATRFFFFFFDNGNLKKQKGRSQKIKRILTIS